jgi:hypothetical protein
MTKKVGAFSAACSASQLFARENQNQTSSGFRGNDFGPTVSDKSIRFNPLLGYL